jgi:hypothetical protein
MRRNHSFLTMLALGSQMLLAACPDVDRPCASDDGCDEGQYCSVGSGLCVDGNPSDYVSDEHGSQCNSVQALRNDFEGEDLGRAWEETASQDKGVAVGLSDGRLRMEVVDPEGTSRHGARRSRHYFSLRDAAITLDVEAALSVGETYLRLADPKNDEWIEIEKNDDLLHFTMVIESGTLKEEIPYDALEHRYWRIRETDGELAFETSSDRELWSAAHLAAPSPEFVDQVRVFLGMNADSEQTPDGPTLFGDLSMDLPASRHCLSDEFQDDFSAPELDTRWERYQRFGECDVAVSEGALQVTATFDHTVNRECGLISRHAYDLRGNTFSIRLGSPAADELAAGITLSSGDGLSFALHHSGERIKSFLKPEDDSPQTEYADVSAPTHLRFRHEETQGSHRVVTEVSDDGGATFPHLVGQISVDEAVLEGLYLGIRIEPDDPFDVANTPQPIVFHFDDVNGEGPSSP